jgi:putative GTP pyrophosphokinase
MSSQRCAASSAPVSPESRQRLPRLRPFPARRTLEAVETDVSGDESGRDSLSEAYRRRFPVLDRLRAEAEWELQQAVEAAGIKLHTFAARVKSEASFLDKVRRKAYADPWSQTQDLVGLRAVCLFTTDLPRLVEVVHSCFSVTSESDTIEGGDDDSFGYMSHHLIARIRPDRSGPRYDDIKGDVFEIQLRTILMDAWANVSHYLDYKGESSIPSQLRRDFFALSGLFYVADKHFELFFLQSKQEREETVASLSSSTSDLDVEINLDTMLGFLVARFPDREHSEPPSVSDLVEELVAAGYKTVADVRDAFDRAERAALAYEKENPPRASDEELEAGMSPRYADVGIIRSALSIADPKVREVRAERGMMPDPEIYTAFGDLLD